MRIFEKLSRWIWDVINDCWSSFKSSKSFISLSDSSKSLNSCSSSLCKTPAITSSNDKLLRLLEQLVELLSTLKTIYHYWGYHFYGFLTSLISKQTSRLASSNSRARVWNVIKTMRYHLDFVMHQRVKELYFF